MDKQKNKRYEYTDKEINAMIDDYVEVPKEEYNTLTRGTHIRYFREVVDENGNKKKQFNSGGIITYIDKEYRYVYLTGFKSRWPVQLNDQIIILKLITLDELRDEYEELLDDYEREIVELKKINRKLYKKLTGEEKEIRTRADKEKKPEKEKRPKISENKVPMSARRSAKAIPKALLTEKHIRL